MQLRTFFSALLVVLLVTSFASAEWELIHHYKLDETTGTTAEDSVGTVDGTLTISSGTAGFSFDDDAITGHIDGALDFTRDDNHIIALGNDTLAFGTDDFKISMWVKRGVLGEREGLFGQYATADENDGSMWARFESGTNLLRFIVDKGLDGAAVDLFSSTALTDTTSWHLLEFAREYSAVDDETTYSISIDGSLDNSLVESGTPYPITGNEGTVIGTYTPTNTRSYDGGLDDFRVYTKAVPEPSSIALLIFGLVSLLGLRRR